MNILHMSHFDIGHFHHFDDVCDILVLFVLVASLGLLLLPFLMAA